MSRPLPLVLFLPWLAWAAPAPTEAPSRGELLYDTHCVTCHTEQVHWRDRRLATDWNSLRAQVLNWRDVLSLSWTEDDVEAVASWLNARHYGFEQPRTRARLVGTQAAIDPVRAPPAPRR